MFVHHGPTLHWHEQWFRWLYMLPVLCRTKDPIWTGYSTPGFCCGRCCLRVSCWYILWFLVRLIWGKVDNDKITSNNGFPDRKNLFTNMPARGQYEDSGKKTITQHRNHRFPCHNPSKLHFPICVPQNNYMSTSILLAVSNNNNHFRVHWQSFS